MASENDGCNGEKAFGALLQRLAERDPLRIFHLVMHLEWCAEKQRSKRIDPPERPVHDSFLSGCEYYGPDCDSEIKEFMCELFEMPRDWPDSKYEDKLWTASSAEVTSALIYLLGKDGSCVRKWAAQVLVNDESSVGRMSIEELAKAVALSHQRWDEMTGLVKKRLKQWKKKEAGTSERSEEMKTALRRFGL